MTLVREKQLIGHTFIPKNKRCYGIAIKNLHPSIVAAIKEAVKSIGNTARGAVFPMLLLLYYIVNAKQ